VLVLLGALQAVRLVADGAETNAQQAAPVVAPRVDDVGRDVPTSFGVVAAESVSTLGGLGARPLAGVTHGIQSLVGPQEMQVQVLVALTNELSRPVAYSPHRFALRVGGSANLRRPRASTLLPGTLQPEASIEGRLVFVAPRSRGRLVLRFSDSNRSIPIDLGRARVGAAPSAYPTHHHVGP
jgi:hypothetical protein